MPAIYHEGSWLGNATDPEVLVKDTVGWTGKNLLPNKVWPFSLSSGSVGSATYQANANATGFCCKVEKNKDYIISRKSSTDANKRFTVVLSKNEPVTGGACQVVFANPAETEYSFNSGNYEYVFLYCGLSLTDTDIRPMLRKADITDPTYEPYHESVEEEIEQVYADNGVLGAKNLMPNNAKSQTINGVTFTVNDDGSVTANGTATATINAFWLYQGDFNLEPNKEYILSGCPSGGSSITYLLTISTWKSGGTYANDTGNGVTINGSDYQYKESPSLRSGIYIVNGTTVNNITFYPMIRLASDPDDTYQPYAMTNRELTEKKINIADLKTVVSASSDFADFKTRIASL